MSTIIPSAQLENVRPFVPFAGLLGPVGLLEPVNLQVAVAVWVPPLDSDRLSGR